MQTADLPPRRAFATVCASALSSNFSLIHGCARKTNPHARTISVVKANAYGHGLAAALPAFLAAGCDFFAVATPDEAFSVRELAPRADILVLGYTPPALAPALAAGGIMQTVFSLEYARALGAACRAAGCVLPVHLKVDGGMCRLGFSPENVAELRRAMQVSGLLPHGIYTHFPVADSDPSATRSALDRFLSCRAALTRDNCLFTHAAASAAALTLPEAVLDGVRVGLALYGIPPVKTSLPLVPALSLLAPVVQLRRVAAGTPVGYGGSYVTTAPALIGTLPMGYADGFPRLSCGVEVTLCHGCGRFPVRVVGRVCMDQMMVDLTGTPAAVGDTVCLFENAAVAAKRHAAIPYEVLTALSDRVERVIK